MTQGSEAVERAEDHVRRGGRLAPLRGSRNDHTRRHNLSALLAAVHFAGPLTRAQLTRDTGLNRSTIGGLVTELAELGLVREGAGGETGTVGRPSLLVRPARDVVAVTVHPDVDAIETAVVGLDGRVHLREREELDEAPSYVDAVAIAARQVAGLLAKVPGHRVAGVGVAMPGLVATDSSTVVRAPHLGWSHVPFGTMLADATGLEVSVANDANLGLQAEWSYGSARGVDNVVYLNGSSFGIGGAARVGGIVLRGGRGYGGEFGHMALRDGGEDCSCGRSGCLETEVSVGRLAAAAGLARNEVEAVDLAEREADRPALSDELDASARALGLAIANLECAFDPELVVLAGFLGSLYEARTELVESTARENAYRPEAEGIAIVRTALRSELLHVGAAERAFTGLLLDPAGTELVAV